MHYHFDWTCPSKSNYSPERQQINLLDALNLYRNHQDAAILRCRSFARGFTTESRRVCNESEDNKQRTSQEREKERKIKSKAIGSEPKAMMIRCEEIREQNREKASINEV